MAAKTRQIKPDNFVVRVPLFRAGHLQALKTLLRSSRNFVRSTPNALKITAFLGKLTSPPEH